MTAHFVIHHSEMSHFWHKVSLKLVSSSHLWSSPFLSADKCINYEQRADPRENGGTESEVGGESVKLRFAQNVIYFLQITQLTPEGSVLVITSTCPHTHTCIHTHTQIINCKNVNPSHPFNWLCLFQSISPHPSPLAFVFISSLHLSFPFTLARHALIIHLMRINNYLGWWHCRH